MHPLIEELKARRRKIGLTQERLSELSGIAQPNIARVESGGVFHSRTYDRLLEAIVRYELDRERDVANVSEEIAEHGPR